MKAHSLLITILLVTGIYSSALLADSTESLAELNKRYEAIQDPARFKLNSPSDYIAILKLLAEQNNDEKQATEIAILEGAGIFSEKGSIKNDLFQDAINKRRAIALLPVVQKWQLENHLVVASGSGLAKETIALINRFKTRETEGFGAYVGAFELAKKHGFSDAAALDLSEKITHLKVSANILAELKKDIEAIKNNPIQLEDFNNVIWPGIMRARGMEPTPDALKQGFDAAKLKAAFPKLGEKKEIVKNENAPELEAKNTHANEYQSDLFWKKVVAGTGVGAAALTTLIHKLQDAKKRAAAKKSQPQPERNCNESLAAVADKPVNISKLEAKDLAGLVLPPKVKKDKKKKGEPDSDGFVSIGEDDSIPPEGFNLLDGDFIIQPNGAVVIVPKTQDAKPDSDSLIQFKFDDIPASNGVPAVVQKLPEAKVSDDSILQFGFDDLGDFGIPKVEAKPVKAVAGEPVKKTKPVKNKQSTPKTVPRVMEPPSVYELEPDLRLQSSPNFYGVEPVRRNP
jgi:hypothetical protein